VGKLNALPGAANVVPGEVRFTLDVRAGTDAQRDAAAAEILSAFAAIAGERGLGFESSLLQDLAASPCDPRLIARLEAAMCAQGLPPRALVSGAGHDAMIMAAHCPTAMLFIRCRDGVSHNPAEHVTGDDAQAALCVMLAFIEGLGDFA
jgi:allantoate deiminase